MRLFISFCVLVLFTACSSNPKGKAENETASDSSQATTISFDEQPAKTVIDFLKWYKNQEDLQNNLVANSDHYDSTKFYSINFEATEIYLNKLKQSGFISEKYLEKWREYFKTCDQDFKSNPQNDGPPDGFDYDFVMNSQDYDQELKNVEKATVSEISGSETKKTMKLKLSDYATLTYDLSFDSGKWYIDDIK